MAGAAIAIEHVSRSFQVGEETVYALRDVSLVVKPGEFVAVIGRSGSGKTTLLNLIAGLDKPSQGAVRFDGEEVAQLSEARLTDLRRKQIGFVFQSFGLLPLLSAQENVELALRIAGSSRRERIDRSRQVLALMGLGRRAHHRPYELSGGEQQRVAIARAIANRPSLILADEPTGELDSLTAVTIFRLLREVARSEQITIVTSTHDRTVMEMASRVVELADGRMLAEGAGRLFSYSTQRGNDHFRAQPVEAVSSAAERRGAETDTATAQPAEVPESLLKFTPPASFAPPSGDHPRSEPTLEHSEGAAAGATPEDPPAPEPLEADEISRWAPPSRRQSN